MIFFALRFFGTRILQFVPLLIFLLSLPATGLTQVVINEIQSSNQTTIADEDGDFEDWIELYNAGTDTVDLGWYGLSDDFDRPFRWVIPDGVSIAPGGFLLIWASGKDRNDPEGELHTNFSIAQAGEEILLTHSLTGFRVDEIPPMRIPSDYSYGRYPDGSGDWHFFDQPTPGAANHSPTFSDQVSDPVPSHEGGFYEAPFQLTIAADPGATLHFTLDGSEPGQDDPIWHDSLLVSVRQPTDYLISYIPTNPPEAADRPIGWKMPQEPPFLSTVLRVRAFREGAMPSRIVTNTYFVLSDVDGAMASAGGYGSLSATGTGALSTTGTGAQSASTRYPLPVVSLVTDSLSLFDHETGIYIPGKRYEDHSFNPPWGFPHANYFYRGEDWERPASFEFFESGGERVLAHDIGIRIHGSMSRALAMKSLRLYARGEYGTSRFEHAFFDHPDAHPRHGERPLADKHRDPSYNRLVLRNSGQDFYRYTTLFRDPMIQGLVDHLNFDTQSYRAAIVFINGEYWGIMNIRERYDRHYLARAHDIDPDRIDYMSGFATVKEGSSAHFFAYRDYLSQHDITDSVHYAHIGTLLDIDNFIDYNIANIYANNRDWPGNNRDYFRHQTEFDPDAGPGRDGRWRYLLIDTDYSFGHQGTPPRPHDDTYVNMLAVATGKLDIRNVPNPAWSTMELRTLLENDQFRSKFINRFAGLMNTVFSPAYVVGHISHYEQLLEPVIEEHISRWSYPPTLSAWRSHIRVMDYFGTHRAHHVRLHMMEQFEELEDTVRVHLDVANVAQGAGGGHSAGGITQFAGGHIRIHDLDIHPDTPGVPEQAYPWTGIYFRDFPVELAAIPSEGFRFAGWMEFPDHPDSVLQIIPDGDIAVTALFEPTGTFADDHREGDDVPGSFRIAQNYPNPFNNRTVIPYEMPDQGRVSLSVYSIDGRRVYHRDEGVRPAGQHRANLRADDWSSGVYIVQMSVRSEDGRVQHRDSRRITLLK